MRWQRRRLANQVMDAYVDWRNQCSAVRVAYSRWACARAGDAGLWHAAYTAALDREELAAKLYGHLLRRAKKFAPPELGLGTGLVVQGVDQ
jgi:hypothetical protein